MKLAVKSGKSKPPERVEVAPSKPQRYSIWSDLEALKFLEQTRQDIHDIDRKIRRTRLLMVLGSLAGGVLFIIGFGFMSLTYTELQLLKQQPPQIPEKTNDVGIPPNNSSANERLDRGN